jgi:hypothetical protein
MPKLPVLAFVVALMVTGCGGSDNTTSTSEKFTISNLLLSRHDLPNGTTVGDTPPELCSPLPILKEEKGQVASSRFLVFGKTSVAEAVGYFNSSAMAASVYKSLNAHERLECIHRAISLYGPSQDTVEPASPLKLRVGDEASLVRYRLVGADSRLKSYGDVISIRVGRCTAALLVTVESGRSSPKVPVEMSERAAAPLVDVCK